MKYQLRNSHPPLHFKRSLTHVPQGNLDLSSKIGINRTWGVQQYYRVVAGYSGAWAHLTFKRSWHFNSKTRLYKSVFTWSQHN